MDEAPAGSPTDSSARSTRRFWITMGSVSAAAILLVVAVSIWSLTVGPTRFGHRTVEDLLSGNARLNPVEATSELCRDVYGCTEGWRTDVGAFLRFNTAGNAEFWATVLGDDGRRFDTLVLDMSGVEQTLEQRIAAVEVLFSTRDLE